MGFGGVCERPQACHRFRAAAQLDHFLLRKKVGTRTVLAERLPKTMESLTPRPDCSQTPPNPIAPHIERNVSYFEFHWSEVIVWWKFCSNGKYLDIPSEGRSMP
jgi:hypothetical protein